MDSETLLLAMIQIREQAATPEEAQAATQELLKEAYKGEGNGVAKPPQVKPSPFKKT